MVIPATFFHRKHGLAAVDRFQHSDMRKPDDVCVRRVNRQRRVIPRPLFEPGGITNVFPAVAAVIGAEQAAILCLNQRVNAIGITGCDPHADLAPNTLRQTVALQFFPGIAAIA